MAREFGDWYEENKDELSDRRKEKYKKDPDYKEKVLQRSRDYRAAHRQAPRVKVPRHSKPKVHRAGDGGKVELFSIGAFAKGISRSIQCVNHWESEGMLPRTPYRKIVKDRGFRYYTRAMAVAVRQIIGEKGRLDVPIDKPAMFKAIKKAWRKLGVPVDVTDGLEAALKATKTSK